MDTNIKMVYRLKNDEIIPVLSIMSLIFYYTINFSKIYHSYFKIFLVISLLLNMIYVFKINKFKVKIKTCVFFVMIAAVFVIGVILQHDTRVLFSLFAIIIGTFIDEKVIFGSMFWTKVLGISFVLITGGYNHLNTLSVNVATTILAYVCYQKHNIKLLQYLTISLVYIIFSIYTKSGAFILGVGLTAYLLFFKDYSKKIRKLLLSKVVQFIYPFLLFLNVYLAMYFYKREIPLIGHLLPEKVNQCYLRFITAVNEILSGRLSLANESLKYFGVSWFGGNVKYDSYTLNGHYFNLDSGMMWLLQGFGIVFTVIIMLLFILLLKYLIENKEYNYIIVAIVIALWATNEDIFLSLNTNFMFFLLGKTLRSYLKKGRKNLYEYS